MSAAGGSTVPARCYAGACSDCDCDVWEGDAAGQPYRASWGYDMICGECAVRDGCNAVGTLTRTADGWVLS